MIDLTVDPGKKEHGDIVYLNVHKFINGRSFPSSYKAFAEEYGYGLSLGQFIIYIPLGDYGDSWEVRSEEIISTYSDDIKDDEDPWFEMESDGSKELVKRWVPFAMSENGYYLFWDIENGEEDNEFDIYVTDFRGTGIRKAGKDLNDVFKSLTSPDAYKTLLPFEQAPLPKTFTPLHIKRS